MKFVFCLLGVLLLSGARAGEARAIPPERLATLARGANIQTVFEQKADVSVDLAALQNRGFRHVRVFVDTDNLADTVFMAKLDRLVNAASTRGMGLILCMTSEQNPWINEGDDAETEAVWTKAWQSLATRYRAISASYLFFEIANEPSLTNSERWRLIQERLRAAIRAIVPDHTLLLTGSPTQIVWALPTPVSTDPDVVYTWHLYQPMNFTHQGADWLPSSIFPAFAGLMYPPNADNIDSLTTDETANDLDEYIRSGATIMQTEIAAGQAWSTEHHVPVMVTEFGVFSVAPAASRAAWLKEARTRLEASGQGWTVWEYVGGFGVAPLNASSPLMQALGLAP